jgi:hypothetical protein
MPRKSRRRPHNMGTVYQRGPGNFWVAWKLKTGGKGAVVPPMRSDGRHCDDHTLRDHLGRVLRTLKLLPANDTHQDAAAKRRPRLNWYR